MFFKIYQPHPALKEFVNHIIVYDLSVDSHTEPPVLSFPPIPENFLYIYIYDTPSVEYISDGKIESLPTSVTIGQQTSRIRLLMPRHNACVRVAFQPAGLYRLLGIPMHKYFFSQGLDSSELFKNDINYVREQLQEAADTNQMVAIVERFLLKKSTRLKSKLPIDSVLPAIISSGGMLKIEDIASQASISFRQLERQFYQRVGVSPKFFMRLSRFSKAWMMREMNPTMSWINIAYQCGYYDQMHFIRDFKEFAGVPPSVLEAEIMQSAHLLKTATFLKQSF